METNKKTLVHYIAKQININNKYENSIGNIALFSQARYFDIYQEVLQEMKDLNK